MKDRLTIFHASLISILFLFGFNATIYAQSSAVFGPVNFVRESGSPQKVSRRFSAQNLTGDFTLIVRNGNLENTRVSSAVIEINGTTIVGPSDFNQKVGQVVKAVGVNQTNTLTVELKGKPGSSITVSIESGAPSSLFPKFILYPNKTDPQLLQAETVNGEIIDYFGEKDDKGLATSLRAIRVKDSQGLITTYHLDSQSRPSLIHFSNGVTFRITYVTDASIIISILSHDGLIELDVPVSLPMAASTSQTNANSLTPAYNLALAQSAPGLTFAQPTSTVVVKHCGIAVNNANVNMEVKTSSGINFNVPGFLTGSGTYQIPIPTPDRSALLRAKQKCLSVARVLDLACEALGHIGPLAPFICPAITAAVALIPVVNISAPAVFTACAAFTAGIDLYCNIGGPQLSELLCGRINLALDRASFGPVVLIPTVTITGEPPRSNLSIAPPDGPFPTFNFDFPCDCQSGLGARFLAPGGNIKIKVLPFEADFTDEIRVLIHGQSRTLATNREIGRVVDLGSFDRGTELIFYIHVRDTGLNFFIGPRVRNSDGLAHARLTCLSGGADVFFEDSLAGGDNDYDDAVFQIIASP